MYYCAHLLTQLASEHSPQGEGLSLGAECRVMDVLYPSVSFGVLALGRQAPCAGKHSGGMKPWDSDAHLQGSKQGKEGPAEHELSHLHHLRLQN